MPRDPSRPTPGSSNCFTKSFAQGGENHIKFDISGDLACLMSYVKLGVDLPRLKDNHFIEVRKLHKLKDRIYYSHACAIPHLQWLELLYSQFQELSLCFQQLVFIHVPASSIRTSLSSQTVKLEHLTH
jgi:hypothetical protein